MRQVVTAIVLFCVSFAGIYGYWRMSTYYPVTRVQTPDGYTVTSVHREVVSQKTCEVVNDTYVSTIRSACSKCEIEYSRCDREVGPAERAVLAGEPSSDYTVVSDAMHLILTGPEGVVRAACDEIARGIVGRGVKSAVCVVPRGAGGK